MPGGESPGGEAAVKGTMLQAHLEWARGRLPGGDLAGLTARLTPQDAAVVAGGVLATDWVPFGTLVRVDRAIAEAVGGRAEEVYRELGRNSARVNLSGAYKVFVQDEPHRFFANAALLHSRFQNFGTCRYERTGPRSARLSFEGYEEPSPVYCASASGYYEGALLAMKAPAPAAAESSCQCRGAASCVFDLSW